MWSQLTLQSHTKGSHQWTPFQSHCFQPLAALDAVSVADWSNTSQWGGMEAGLGGQEVFKTLLFCRAWTLCSVPKQMLSASCLLCQWDPIWGNCLHTPGAVPVRTQTGRGTSDPWITTDWFLSSSVQLGATLLAQVCLSLAVTRRMCLSTKGDLAASHHPDSKESLQAWRH